MQHCFWLIRKSIEFSYQIKISAEIHRIFSMLQYLKIGFNAHGEYQQSWHDVFRIYFISFIHNFVDFVR